MSKGIGAGDTRYEAVISIGHSLLGKDAFDFERDELHAVVMLAAGGEKLVHDADRLDTQSQKGWAACARFLKKAEKAAAALKVEQAPRAFRERFTANFKALFAGSERSYRVDVLEASLSLTPAVWANGEAYELSEAAVNHAKDLREAWLGLRELLAGWSSPERTASGRARSELCARLRRLDLAWAGFEEAYVDGLLQVQQRARGALAGAIEQEGRLQAAEAASRTDRSEDAMDAYRQEEVALLEHLGQLSVAAGAPKPSTQVAEFAVQILDEAVQVLAISGACCDQGVPDPTVVLAARAVDSYKGLRDYLVNVKEHMDKVHPQLARNAGLTERLTRWEESWERAALYTENPDLMEGVRQLVGFLACALEAAPPLRQLLEDRDAELFLVLPRLVCLCLLSDPEGGVTRLLQPLMPSRLAGADPDAMGFDQALAASADLEDVIDLLGGAAEQTAWEALARRAVAGAGAPPAGTCSEVDPAAASAVEDLMREVEGWSMELQRHNPGAWNDLSDLLVQCLDWRPGDEHAAPPAAFAV